MPAPSLAATFNNTGITDNANTNPSASFVGFDGIGTSYSAQGLAADGPDARRLGQRRRAHLHLAERRRPPSPTTPWRRARPSRSPARGPASASWPRPTTRPSRAPALIYYTDGSTQPFTLNVGNFWYPPGQNGNPANVQVAAVNYANYPTGSSGHQVYVFEQSVPLDPSKTVAAVTLPSLGDVAGYNPALHIFAMSIG